MTKLEIELAIIDLADRQASTLELLKRLSIAVRQMQRTSVPAKRKEVNNNQMELDLNE